MCSPLVWTPELDALVLAGHAAGTRPEELGHEAELPAGTAAAFRSLVRRRPDREPLEYITGRATLFGLEFEVGEGTFIPRVHSEAMVGQAPDRCPDGPLRVVDLCTGSGALALAVGALRPGSDITGVDISASAVQWAKRNADGCAPGSQARSTSSKGTWPTRGC
ncbi:N5-glutamine methyltransferase family protein [Streptomyces johnsoniae]|uniref:Methyltransferase domain-containing protein n=1 Tax=Streptomyces johnsoniae TaxID=3075532 RepID=A0ABU2SEG6_9ACTN|nr:methyltransferase [Streptomyces sp. DSM 41886]MDT0447362.1 methyltransferase domain-containing protein [Streptomyces sp. DSM 41886]